MKTKKKTGLGKSLLLRRTIDPRESPEAPLPVVPSQEAMFVSEGLPPSMNKPEAEPAPAIQSHGKPTKKSLVLHDRCTLYLEREINERLSLTAGIKGPDRSDIVNDILRKHLPTYRIEIEGQAGQ